jgi:hypothetical protein
MELVSDEGKALANALRQQESQVEKLNEKLQKTKEQLKGSAQHSAEFGKGLKDVVSNIVGITTVAGAVGAIVAELKNMYQEMRKIADESKNARLTIAQSRSAAMVNLPTDFEGGSAGLDAMVERIASKSKLDTAKIFQAMNSALSAKGSATMTQFEDASTLAAKISARSGGQVDAGALIGSLLDVMTKTGLEDPEKALGWVMQAGAASRVTSLQGQLRFVPGVSGAMARGMAPEKAMEMQSAISQLITDPTGERTATGFAEFLGSLYKDEVVPSKTRKVDPRTGRVSQETEWAMLTAGTVEGRIEELQKTYAAADEKTRGEIEKRLGGSGLMQGFIQNMLNNTAIYQKTMSTVASQIEAPGSEAGKQQAVKLLENMSAGKFGQLQETELATAQVVEKSRLAEGRTPLVSREQAIQSYEKIYREQGITGFNLFARTKGMEFGAFTSGKTVPEYMLKSVDDLQAFIDETKNMSYWERATYRRNMMDAKGEVPTPTEVDAFRNNTEALKELRDILASLVELEKTKAKTPPETNPNQQEIQ